MKIYRVAAAILTVSCFRDGALASALLALPAAADASVTAENVAAVASALGTPISVRDLPVISAVVSAKTFHAGQNNDQVLSDAVLTAYGGDPRVNAFVRAFKDAIAGGSYLDLAAAAPGRLSCNILVLSAYAEGRRDNIYGMTDITYDLTRGDLGVFKLTPILRYGGTLENIYMELSGRMAKSDPSGFSVYRMTRSTDHILIIEEYGYPAKTSLACPKSGYSPNEKGVCWIEGKGLPGDKTIYAKKVDTPAVFKAVLSVCRL